MESSDGKVANARGERGGRAASYYAFGSVDTDPRWWWTIGRFGLCDSCGAEVTRARIAYESESRVVYCQGCSEELGIAGECVESKRARRARQQRLIRDWGVS
jgi:hypothetical protein